MRVYFGTDTGSIYEITDTHLTRMKQGARSGALRRDGESLRHFGTAAGRLPLFEGEVVPPLIGKRYLILLAGLGDGPYTARQTSPIRWIRWWQS